MDSNYSNDLITTTPIRQYKLKQLQSTPIPYSSTPLRSMSTNVHIDQQQQQQQQPKHLKRLSLLGGRPPSLDLEREKDSSSGASTIETPRRTPIRGKRSSILYSPSLGSGSSRDFGLGLGLASGSGSSLGLGFGIGIGIDERLEEERPVQRIVAAEEKGVGMQRAQTLTEKHADLLTLIAQRERRVAELRQELQVQEESLAGLKRKWAEVVSESRPPATAPPVQANTSRLRPTPLSTSLSPTLPLSSTTSSSSISSTPIPETPEPPSTISLHTSTSTSTYQSLLDDTNDGGAGAGATAAITNFLQAYPGEAAKMGEEVVQGGRRFLGVLMKTVSAAAGGTVPTSTSSVGEGEGEVGRGKGKGDLEAGLSEEGGLDLSSLRSLMPSFQLLSPTSTSSSTLPSTSTSASASTSAPERLSKSMPPPPTTRREKKPPPPVVMRRKPLPSPTSTSTTSFSSLSASTNQNTDRGGGKSPDLLTSGDEYFVPAYSESGHHQAQPQDQGQPGGHLDYSNRKGNKYRPRGMDGETGIGSDAPMILGKVMTPTKKVVLSSPISSSVNEDEEDEWGW